MGIRWRTLPFSLPPIVSTCKRQSIRWPWIRHKYNICPFVNEKSFCSTHSQIRSSYLLQINGRRCNKISARNVGMSKAWTASSRTDCASASWLVRRSLHMEPIHSHFHAAYEWNYNRIQIANSCCIVIESEFHKCRRIADGLPTEHMCCANLLGILGIAALYLIRIQGGNTRASTSFRFSNSNAKSQIRMNKYCRIACNNNDDGRRARVYANIVP